jgi:hypothetical protein
MNVQIAQNIMNDNKLIAEFMDLETPDGVYYEYLTKDGHRSELTHFILLEYHTSWDWIMPVVEKIMWDNDIEDNQCTNIEEALCDAKIDRVYDAVVEFIKQYDNQRNAHS